MTNIRDKYFALRAEGWRASQALYAARSLVDWDNAGGDIVDYDADCEPGTVRLRIVPEMECYDDSYLDTWDMRPSELERVRRELWDRIACDGVYGVIGEYWDGDDWEHADSCYGFIGDDWRSSGYDHDIMRATLDALDKHQQSEARALEVTRPDMYGVQL